MKRHRDLFSFLVAVMFMATAVGIAMFIPWAQTIEIKQGSFL
jgi:hypothetical protein